MLSRDRLSIGTTVIALVGLAVLGWLVTTVPGETIIDVLDPPMVGADSVILSFADTLGSFPTVGVAAAALAWSIAPRSRAVALGVIVVAATGEIATGVLKTLVDRPRPSGVALEELIGSASFPSGHVVRTALVAGLMLAVLPSARRHPRIAVAIAVAAVVGMAAARVAAGVHHTSDVVGGALLAALILGLFVTASRVRWRTAWRGGAIAACLVLTMVITALDPADAWAASPSPPAGGDARVPSGGASLIGEPVVAIVGTLVVGVGAALGTWIYIRLTPSRGKKDPPR